MPPFDLDALLDRWDGEAVVADTDEPTGTRIFIAIHSTRLGPATGGTRMKTYPSPETALQDAMHLAEAMTLKFALADFPAGGGKAVLAIPEGLDRDPAARTGLLRRYGQLLQRCSGLFRTGPDVGTSSADMDLLYEEAPGFVFARSRELGGAGDSGPWTALGVFCAIEATLAWLEKREGCDENRGRGGPGLSPAAERLLNTPQPSPVAGRPLDITRPSPNADQRLDTPLPSPAAGRRIVVQGAGAVGGPLMLRLREAGAEVLFTDNSPSAIRRYRDELGFALVPSDAALETPCDVLSPCALGGVLNAETIPRLRCLAVAGASNNPLSSPEDAARLRDRGILYAPDFVVNFGGAVAITGMEAYGWGIAEAEARVRRVAATLTEIYRRAEAHGTTPDEAARALADERAQGGVRRDPR